MQTVIVLLSAYNGEKYIAEQLDSVLAQEGMDVRIQIRDDGSTDGTLQILEQYRSRFPDRIRSVVLDTIGSVTVYQLVEIAIHILKTFFS